MLQLALSDHPVRRLRFCATVHTKLVFLTKGDYPDPSHLKGMKAMVLSGQPASIQTATLLADGQSHSRFIKTSLHDCHVS